MDSSKLKVYFDRLMGAVVAVCLLAGIGHLIDWTDSHVVKDLQISIAFFAVWVILIFCSANRIKALFYCFLAITAFGILGAITGRSLAGLPILLPSAIITVAMLVWKSDQITK